MTRNVQKKMRRLTLLACSAILLVCVSIGATFAYLTGQDVRLRGMMDTVISEGDL